jgi:uncharacterized SAM-binding protein YcdF (DUF218 family)
VYLSKILPLFVMPVIVSIGLMLLALVLLRYDKRRSMAAVLSLAVLVLWVSSTPIVAGIAYRAVEANYPAKPLASIPDGDCIVVLGGALGAPMPPRVDVEFNEAVDRVYKTAQLFRAGKGRVVIVTAGNQPWSESRWAEAELIRDLLVEWGVPHDVVVLEGSSRNTRENAVYSKNIIDAYMCENTLLVTSAAHMPRSLAAFKSIGVNAFPVSTDVRVSDGNAITVMDFLPDAHALEMTSDAIREWIGRWYYEFQGWN